MEGTNDKACPLVVHWGFVGPTGCAAVKALVPVLWNRSLCAHGRPGICHGRRTGGPGRLVHRPERMHAMGAGHARRLCPNSEVRVCERRIEPLRDADHADGRGFSGYVRVNSKVSASQLRNPGCVEGSSGVINFGESQYAVRFGATNGVEDVKSFCSAE